MSGSKQIYKNNTHLGLKDEWNTFLQNTVNIYRTSRCYILKEINIHINNFVILILRHGRIKKAPISDVLVVQGDTAGQTLINFLLQAEYDNTFSCQHDKVRDKECTYKQLKRAILQYFLRSSLENIEWKLSIILLRFFWLCEECKPQYIPKILCKSLQHTRKKAGA